MENMKQYQIIQDAAGKFSKAIEEITGRPALVTWTSIDPEDCVIFGKFTSSPIDSFVMNQMVLGIISYLTSEHKTLE